MPKQAQDILRKYSGEWFANQFITKFGTYVDDLLVKMKADPNRVAIQPTAADMATAETAFKQVIAGWEKKNPKNSGLLKQVRDEIAKIRAGG